MTPGLVPGVFAMGMDHIMLNATNRAHDKT
jgi:hypothetical protein